jgi:choline kinase
MKGVILAAGLGTRLSEISLQIPKVLLPVAGRPVIDHTLEAFGQVGVTDVAIIVGYQGQALQGRIGDGSEHGLQIEYIYNPDYQRGNALSLYAAKPFTEDAPFLLSMADHMVSSHLLAGVLNTAAPGNVLGVDFDPSPRNVEEGTRVLVNQEGLVTDLGKGLSHWNGIDAGVFRLTPAIYEAIGDLVREEKPEYELGQAMSRMIDLGYPLQSCDVSGCFWQDIDTLDDLHFVRQALAG